MKSNPVPFRVNKLSYISHRFPWAILFFREDNFAPYCFHFGKDD
jgi:hypothetical protein